MASVWDNMALPNPSSMETSSQCLHVKPNWSCGFMKRANEWSHNFGHMRSHYCALTSNQKKTWRTRMEKRESHKFTHYFQFAKICFIVKDKQRKILVFGLEFLNCRCHFFPGPNSSKDAILPWNVGRSHFFVCLFVFLLPFSFYHRHHHHSRHSTHTFCSQQTQHTQTNSIYYSIYSGEYISHYCLYHWNATAIGSVYPVFYLFLAHFFSFFALIWRHNNVHSKLWKIFAKCYHQQLLQRIEDICLCFGFCFFFLPSFFCAGRRGIHLILSIILTQ